MVTIDDMGKVVTDRQAAVAGYSTTLPGKAWFGRGPSDDPAGYPYSVAQIEFGAAKNDSGGGYTQPWTVRLAAYAPVGATGVNPQTVEQLFNNALVSTAAIAALRATALRNTGDKIISSKLVPGKGEYAKELREGRDVFVCGLTAEILVQGDKGAT